MQNQDRQGLAGAARNVATYIEVAENNGIAHGIVSGDMHHNPSALPIGDDSDDELRKRCEVEAVKPGF